MDIIIGYSWNISGWWWIWLNVIFETDVCWWMMDMGYGIIMGIFDEGCLSLSLWEPHESHGPMDWLPGFGMLWSVVKHTGKQTNVSSKRCFQTHLPGFQLLVNGIWWDLMGCEWPCKSGLLDHCFDSYSGCSSLISRMVTLPIAIKKRHWFKYLVTLL